MTLNELPNQMRQTKAMSQAYAIRWWRERDLAPPEIDPLEFVLKKIAWRYAKGRLVSNTSNIYRGDSRKCLRKLVRFCESRPAKLLFTSPPYQGITNYYYDQWLRLWLLGGPTEPRSPGEECKRKFENHREYPKLLETVFSRSAPLLAPTAVAYVRTDARKFTLGATIEALERAYPRKRLREELYSRPKVSQTSLFGSANPSDGEVDLIMW